MECRCYTIADEEMGDLGMLVNSVANQGGVWDSNEYRMRGTRGEKALDVAGRKQCLYPAQGFTQKIHKERSGIGPRMTLQTTQYIKNGYVYSCLVNSYQVYSITQVWRFLASLCCKIPGKREATLNLLPKQALPPAGQHRAMSELGSSRSGWATPHSNGTSKS